MESIKLSMFDEIFSFQVFISNDINLRNKALIEDIEAYSVEKFKELFLENDDPSMTRPRLELRLKDTIRVVLTEVRFLKVLAKKQTFLFSDI